MLFYWRASTRAASDVLRFGVNGTAHRLSLSGDTPWEAQLLPLPAGSHRLQWTYTRGVGSDGYADAAYVAGVRDVTGVDWDSVADACPEPTAVYAQAEGVPEARCREYCVNTAGCVGVAHAPGPVQCTLVSRVAYRTCTGSTVHVLNRAALAPCAPVPFSTSAPTLDIDEADDSVSGLELRRCTCESQPVVLALRRHFCEGDDCEALLTQQLIQPTLTVQVLAELYAPTHVYINGHFVGTLQPPATAAFTPYTLSVETRILHLPRTPYAGRLRFPAQVVQFLSDPLASPDGSVPGCETVEDVFTAAVQRSVRVPRALQQKYIADEGVLGSCYRRGRCLNVRWLTATVAAVRPMLLAHGDHRVWHGTPLQRWLQANGVTHRVVGPEDISDATLQSLCDATGARRVSLVCHGVAAFRCMKLSGRLVDGIVAVSAPLDGSPLADLATGPGAMQRLMPSWMGDGRDYIALRDVAVTHRGIRAEKMALYVEGLECFNDVCQPIGSTDPQDGTDLKWGTRLVSRRGMAAGFRLLIKVWQSTATGDGLVLQGSEYLRFGGHDARAVFEDGDVTVSLTVRFHDFPERAFSTAVEQGLAARLASAIYGDDVLWSNVSYEWRGALHWFYRVDASAEAEAGPQWGMWRCDTLKVLVVGFRYMITGSDTWATTVGAQVRDCSTLGGLYAGCRGTVVNSHVQRWVKWSDRILHVIKAQQRTLRVLVIGHALGGAIAQHCFYALGKAMSQSPFEYHRVQAAGLIALGAPKVGDTGWRQSFRDAMLANEKLQYADLIVRVDGDQQDPVAGLCTSGPAECESVGRIWYLTDTGRMVDGAAPAAVAAAVVDSQPQPIALNDVGQYLRLLQKGAQDWGPSQTERLDMPPEALGQALQGMGLQSEAPLPFQDWLPTSSWAQIKTFPTDRWRYEVPGIPTMRFAGSALEGTCQVPGLTESCFDGSTFVEGKDDLIIPLPGSSAQVSLHTEDCRTFADHGCAGLAASLKAECLQCPTAYLGLPNSGHLLRLVDTLRRWTQDRSDVVAAPADAGLTANTRRRLLTSPAQAEPSVRLRDAVGAGWLLSRTQAHRRGGSACAPVPATDTGGYMSWSGSFNQSEVHVVALPLVAAQTVSLHVQVTENAAAPAAARWYPRICDPVGECSSPNVSSNATQWVLVDSLALLTLRRPSPGPWTFELAATTAAQLQYTATITVRRASGVAFGGLHTLDPVANSSVDVDRVWACARLDDRWAVLDFRVSFEGPSGALLGAAPMRYHNRSQAYAGDITLSARVNTSTYYLRGDIILAPPASSGAALALPLILTCTVAVVVHAENVALTGAFWDELATGRGGATLLLHAEVEADSAGLYVVDAELRGPGAAVRAPAATLALPGPGLFNATLQFDTAQWYAAFVDGPYTLDAVVLSAVPDPALAPAVVQTLAPRYYTSAYEWWALGPDAAVTLVGLLPDFVPEGCVTAHHRLVVAVEVEDTWLFSLAWGGRSWNGVWRLAPGLHVLGTPGEPTPVRALSVAGDYTGYKAVHARRPRQLNASSFAAPTVMPDRYDCRPPASPSPSESGPAVKTTATPTATATPLLRTADPVLDWGGAPPQAVGLRWWVLLLIVLCAVLLLVMGVLLVFALLSRAGPLRPGMSTAISSLTGRASLAANPHSVMRSHTSTYGKDRYLDFMPSDRRLSCDLPLQAEPLQPGAIATLTKATREQRGDEDSSSGGSIEIIDLDMDVDMDDASSVYKSLSPKSPLPEDFPLPHMLSPTRASPPRLKPVRAMGIPPQGPLLTEAGDSTVLFPSSPSKPPTRGTPLPTNPLAGVPAQLQSLFDSPPLPPPPEEAPSPRKGAQLPAWPRPHSGVKADSRPATVESMTLSPDDLLFPPFPEDRGLPRLPSHADAVPTVPQRGTPSRSTSVHTIFGSDLQGTAAHGTSSDQPPAREAWGALPPAPPELRHDHVLPFHEAQLLDPRPLDDAPDLMQLLDAPSNGVRPECAREFETAGN